MSIDDPPAAIHRVLFEIAAYRIGLDAWRAETNQRTEQRVERLRQQFGADSDLDLDEIILRTVRLTNPPGHWLYNEIVGWIRLMQDGSAIKAYLHAVTSPASGFTLPRRSYRRGFKPYPFAGGDPMMKLFEAPYGLYESDRAIYEDVHELLENVTSPEGDLPGHTLDLEAFEAVGPHVNWTRLLRGGVAFS